MKSSLGNGELIRFPRGWKGPQPPADKSAPTVGVKSAAQRIRERGVDGLQALFAILQRAKGIRASKLADLPLNSSARDEFTGIVDALQRADQLMAEGRVNGALLNYVDVLERVCEARCVYGKHPEEAFE